MCCLHSVLADSAKADAEAAVLVAQLRCHPDKSWVLDAVKLLAVRLVSKVVEEVVTVFARADLVGAFRSSLLSLEQQRFGLEEQSESQSRLCPSWRIVVRYQ